jgi:hypothetical protein
MANVLLMFIDNGSDSLPLTTKLNELFKFKFNKHQNIKRSIKSSKHSVPTFPVTQIPLLIPLWSDQKGESDEERIMNGVER